MATPGHTPGSTTLVLSSGTERIMFLGDVVHCPIQLEEDEWSALFDVDPELAKRTRNALARELEGSDVRVSGPTSRRCISVGWCWPKASAASSFDHRLGPNPGPISVGNPLSRVRGRRG